jgi:outer membrane protein OmpA-like peptidoglycan-associated protein
MVLRAALRPFGLALASCVCAVTVGCGATVVRIEPSAPRVASCRADGVDDVEEPSGVSTWRARYRLTLADALSEGDATLEAWALVHNGSDEDWDGVSLVLEPTRPTPSPSRAPGDPDGDGIGDADDLCSTEAEDRDAFEDADGCPDPDNDQDRILDEDDQCPNEPETYNGTDDGDGCPDHGHVIVSDSQIVILEKLYFRRNSSEIDARQQPLVEAIAATLAFNPQILRIELSGHASDDESDPWALSAQRAAALHAALVARGVGPERLVIRPFGNTRPVDPLRTRAARERNRRTEFEILATNYDVPPSAPAPRPVLVSAPSRSSAVTPCRTSEGVEPRLAVAVRVSIGARATAPVMYASARVAGEEVYLFRPDPAVAGSEAHPFRARRFVNRTALAIVPGPVAVFAHGAVVGEGLLGALAPDEVATIAYALDESTVVLAASSSVTEPADVRSIAQGVMVVEDRELVRTRYVIHAGPRAPSRIFVQHARLASYAARDLPSSTQELPGEYVIPVSLEAGREAEFVLEEMRLVRHTVRLDEDLSTPVAPYLEASRLPDMFLAPLRAALEKRSALAALEREAEEVRERLSAAALRNTTTREDLRAISAELAPKIAAVASARLELTARLGGLIMVSQSPH